MSTYHVVAKGCQKDDSLTSMFFHWLCINNLFKVIWLCKPHSQKKGHQLHSTVNKRGRYKFVSNLLTDFFDSHLNHEKFWIHCKVNIVKPYSIQLKTRKRENTNHGVLQLWVNVIYRIPSSASMRKTEGKLSMFWPPSKPNKLPILPAANASSIPVKMIMQNLSLLASS